MSFSLVEKKNYDYDRALQSQNTPVDVSHLPYSVVILIIYNRRYTVIPFVYYCTALLNMKLDNKQTEESKQILDFLFLRFSVTDLTTQHVVFVCKFHISISIFWLIASQLSLLSRISICN